MGKVFFVDWALWQKMTFVLACAIVLTIGIGWIKVLHTNRKLKKLSKPVGARADQEPQMVEAAAVPRRKSGDEIPFGIRAIQSGIEVDGIWISGTNTPVPSSPTQSAHDKPEASGSNSRPMSTLEIPPAAGPSSGPSSRPSSCGPPSASFDRAASTERVASHSRDSSPGSSASGQRARQHRPPPTAYTRYSQASMLRHSATLDTLEGDDEDAQAAHERSASANANPYVYTFSSNGSSRKSSGSSDNNPPDRSDDDTVETARMGKAPMASIPRTRDPRTDLRLLQSHRMSHVAETGSLARRERPERPTGRSGDWSNMSMDAPYSRSASNSGPPSPPSGPISGPPSPHTPPMAQGANPFMAPLESANSPTRDSHPENVAAHAVPLLETYQPRGPNFDDDTPQAYASQHDSQVLRKVNSGFEILRPGTFPIGPTEEALRAQQPPKKLQKKRRPSEADSRVSSFVEQV
ncbi:hypothetical protein MPH_03298 [Macrophomina phaseolina MS6]|uniref:Uncharacterized protein n=1 Tax=Macrophomina phaseolina (strain MS6) TaxID=1126212 RepID=K2SRX2_MACPH|nr:hypothetical protein MPH_03298 [Macrophomina phaseolina MS6]